MKSFLRRKQAQVIAALVMATAVWTMVGGLGLSNGIAEAATLHNRHFQSHVQQVPLTRTNRGNINCDGSITGPIMHRTFGSVTFEVTFKNERQDQHADKNERQDQHANKIEQITVTVRLRHATPNTIYNFRVIQTPNAGLTFPCNAAFFPLPKTDSKGNATQTATVGGLSIRSTTKDAFVAINSEDNPSTDFFTTREVFFKNKDIKNRDRCKF